MTLKIGTRIHHKVYGDGTLLEEPEGEVWVGVQFDTPNPSLHNCGNLCPDGYGYYVHTTHLVPLNESRQLELFDDT